MENKAIFPRESPPVLGWWASISWLAFGIGCFHLAYASTRHPAAGLAIIGYAFGLVRLAHQPTIRRAFYFGLAAGLLGYGPQLWFFTRIFSAAAVVLWLVLAFWVAVFAATACGCLRRWGWPWSIWLIPVLWTGIEYFRSEVYYLKFSWLNLGYALPQGCGGLGMYGLGFFAFVVAAALCYRRCIPWVWTVPAMAAMAAVAIWLFVTGIVPMAKSSDTVSVVGVQMEFPPENALPRMLDRALAHNPGAQIFVLSEYTLNGPVPVALKNWCQKHDRFLVVGGEAPAGTNNYYNTAFVVGTNGEVVFQQDKCVPIQFFSDGLPAPAQSVWNSPWGKIGLCICYDLSYRRVTDELIHQGARMLIVPTMDLEDWGVHQHELHTRVAPVRAAEYGVPIFRLASSGISQAVAGGGAVVAEAPMPGNGAMLAATLNLPPTGSLPIDRFLAPLCAVLTAAILLLLLVPQGFSAWRGKSAGLP